MKDRSPITTHILDVNRGKPAAKVAVTLEHRTSASEWKVLGRGETNADGRAEDLLAKGHTVTVGVYRLTFATAEYFAGLGTKSFYPFVTVAFEITDPAQHHHVPLLLSGHGYSTYRGS